MTEQTGDAGGLTAEQSARRAAMAILARADADELETAWANWPDRPEIRPLRGPETGLIMLRGRIGGGGAPFNLGEATVTRATIELADGTVGHAHALGTDKEKATHAAIIDALWQDPSLRGRVEKTILEPIRRRLEAGDRDRRDETAATRVDFFTMVRGED